MLQAGGGQNRGGLSISLKGSDDLPDLGEFDRQLVERLERLSGLVAGSGKAFVGTPVRKGEGSGDASAEDTSVSQGTAGLGNHLRRPAKPCASESTGAGRWGEASPASSVGAPARDFMRRILLLTVAFRGPLVLGAWLSMGRLSSSKSSSAAPSEVTGSGRA